jgi:hypothetical protein
MSLSYSAAVRFIAAMRRRFTLLSLGMIPLTTFSASDESKDASEVFGFEKVVRRTLPSRQISGRQSSRTCLLGAADGDLVGQVDGCQRWAGGGPGIFSPGGMLIPGFQTAAGHRHERKPFPRTSFVAGFDRWFTAWDSKKQGYLDGDAIRAGMNKDLTPTFGPPPGGGPVSGTRGPGPSGTPPAQGQAPAARSRSGWTSSGWPSRF